MILEGDRYTQQAIEDQNLTEKIWGVFFWCYGSFWILKPTNFVGKCSLDQKNRSTKNSGFVAFYFEVEAESSVCYREIHPKSLVVSFGYLTYFLRSMHVMHKIVKNWQRTPTCKNSTFDLTSFRMNLWTKARRLNALRLWRKYHRHWTLKLRPNHLKSHVHLWEMKNIEKHWIFATTLFHCWRQNNWGHASFINVERTASSWLFFASFV